MFVVIGMSLYKLYLTDESCFNGKSKPWLDYPPKHSTNKQTPCVEISTILSVLNK